MTKNIPFIRRIEASLYRIFPIEDHFTLSSTLVVGKKRSCALFLVTSLFLAGQSQAQVKPTGDTTTSTDQRYVLIQSDSISEVSEESPAKSSCIFDKKTYLTWEVKTSDGGLQDSSQTYSWYEPDRQINGGDPGYRRQGKCTLTFCDTKSYIGEINRRKLCGRSDWRLPTREELRTLVDYGILYPGPTIDQRAFPNTVSQFYWSSTANANDDETAWGIGFSFGYDYAYFKSDHGYVRLVSGPN